ncbi:MAG: hypothetical protein Q4F65_13515 [Propionibacteriaceae bacterium]|nr:hypothetical protein [Propionibacteriaceae bacterium]
MNQDAPARLRLFEPIAPTQAGTAGSVAEALANVTPGRPVVIEAVSGGSRIQAHKRDAEVRLFDATLADVTDQHPAIVDAVRTIDADTLIVDGTVRTDAASGEVNAVFSDALLIDGAPLLGRPLSDRIDLLGEVAPTKLMVQRTLTPFPAVAEAFAAHVREQGGCEVVVRDLDAPYTPGTPYIPDEGAAAWVVAL